MPNAWYEDDRGEYHFLDKDFVAAGRLIPRLKIVSDQNIIDMLNSGGAGFDPSLLAGYATKQDVEAKADMSALEAKADKSALDNYATKTALSSGLSGKVDKVPGKVLSSNDFTDALRDKLAGLDGNHYRGTHNSVDAAMAAVKDWRAGDYCEIVSGDTIERYIWDSVHNQLAHSSVQTAAETPASVLKKLTSNPDTNVLTDAQIEAINGLDKRFEAIQTTIDEKASADDLISISEEDGNIIEQREDGIYARNEAVAISHDEGNSIVMREDGLFNDASGVARGDRGYSAYEIAVQRGFNGDEDAWLLSLQGADGKGGTYEEVLMGERKAWEVFADEEGKGKWIAIKQDIALGNDITQFDLIRFEIDPADTSSGIQQADFEVHDIVYNDTEEFRTGGSRLEVVGTWVKENDTAGSFGAYHTTLSGWFKDARTFFVDRIGVATTEQHDFRIEKIYGIKQLNDQSFSIDTVLTSTSGNAVAASALSKAIYQKDYLFATMTADDTIKLSAIADGRNPLTEWTRKETNMDITSKPGFVKLRAGRIYKAEFQVLYGYGCGSLYIIDDAGKRLSNRGFVSGYTTSYSDVVAVAIIAPEADMYIRPSMAKPSISSGQTSSATWYRQCSFFTVTQL